jgi:PAS domain S-box-containing protein
MPIMDDLNSLLQVIGSPAYFFDFATYEVLAVNRAFVEMMEYSEAELLGMSLFDLRPEEDVPKVRKALTRPTPEGSVEWRYKTRPGRILFVQLTYRNSVHMDKKAGKMREVRLVVISKWDTAPVQKADELFG